MTNIYKGDTWEFEYRITDRDNKAIDLTTFEVKAGIKDSDGTITIKKNTLAGGSNAELEILDTKGNILITFTKENTETIAVGDIVLEIEITSNIGKRYTVVRESYKVIDDII